MNTKLLESIQSQVQSGSIPENYEHFAGADLIISDRANRERHGDETFICSLYASQLSWLVFQLREIYTDEITI